MPRRKIGADLKEALCKLYEAGDISADTIEKHGIMSRATFFRNLKMYKTGASLEQRHSTGRKTNADKLKELERQELDSLQPLHLSHLELVLLLDDDERNSQGAANGHKRKAKGPQGSSKRRGVGKGWSGDTEGNENATIAEDSASESEEDADEAVSLVRGQALDKLTQAARSFLMVSDGDASSGSHFSDNFADLDSLLRPEDSNYSNSNRGALFVVRRRGEKKQGGEAGDIIAAIALRSLIWTPQIYQALGPSYASRSIDKVCNLTRLRVDPVWQRKGIGRWLVQAAELKACKLGFSHLYTQSSANRNELLSFWRKVDFQEFARLDNVARLEKKVIVPMMQPKGGASKRPTSQVDSAATPSSSASAQKVTSPPAVTVAEGEAALQKQLADDRLLAPGEVESGQTASTSGALEIDPALPLDPMALPSTTSFSIPNTAAATKAVGSPTSTHSATLLHASPRHQTTASQARYALGSDSSADPSSSTSRDAIHMQADPPLRKIAFQEANSAKSGSAA